MVRFIEEPKSGLVSALHECERMLVAVCDKHGVNVVALLTLGDEIAAICARRPVDSPGCYDEGDYDAVMALRLPFAGAHPDVPPVTIHWLIEAARCSREIRALMSAGDLGGAICRLPLLARTSAFARLERPPSANEVQSEFARTGAAARHAENRDSKSFALQHFEDHKHQYTSLDDAADKIAGAVVPYKWRTVRDWLKGRKLPKRGGRARGPD